MKTLIAILLLTSLCYGQESKAYKLADAIIASRKAKAYADSICSQPEHIQTSIETIIEKWDMYKAWAKESVKTPTGTSTIGVVVDSIKLYRSFKGDSVTTFLYRLTPDSAFTPREHYPTFDKFIEWLRANK